MSSVDLVKAKLFSMLGALDEVTNGQQLQVGYGFPENPSGFRVIVADGGSDLSLQDINAAGNDPWRYDEVINLDVIWMCRRELKLEADRQIGDAQRNFLDVIRSDPTLGDVVDRCVVLRTTWEASIIEVVDASFCTVELQAVVYYD